MALKLLEFIVLKIFPEMFSKEPVVYMRDPMSTFSLGFSPLHQLTWMLILEVDIFWYKTLFPKKVFSETPASESVNGYYMWRDL